MSELSRKKTVACLLITVCVFAVSIASGFVLPQGDEQDEQAATVAAEESPAGARSVEQPVSPHDEIDRSQFMGSRACLDCHRSEYVSWLNSGHYSNRKNRFDGTENSIDTKYRNEVGNLDLCFTCHSLPKEQRFGRAFVESGTSCESCHGASGGEPGWLNRHAVYGPNVTRLQQESPEHYSERVEYCEQAGMIRPAQPYLVAKNCFSCHIIGIPELAAADHPVLHKRFSLIPFLSGEVRHNFHMDQKVNAAAPSLEMLRREATPSKRNRIYFIVEQLAKMEVAYGYMAALSSEDEMEGDTADDLIDVVDDAVGELEDFVEVLQEPEDEDIPALSDDDVAELLTAIEIFEDFDDLDEKKRSDAADCAARIAECASGFLAKHDGTQLTGLDEEFLEDLDDPVGDVLKADPAEEDSEE